jgi:murein DD-endopeptidase MepM/ murein hydrolase activator NlpD
MSAALALAALALAAPAASPLPDCDPARARVSTAAPIQGGIVLLEVAAEAAADKPAATWQGKPVRFWREDGGPWRALLGVDLAQRPGAARTSIRGLARPCVANLSVRAGTFPEEQLTVPERYVELRPEDQARAAREAARLAALFRTVTTERLWHGPFRLPLEAAEPSSSFGGRRVLNGRPRSPHTGVDIGAPTGTKVHAMQRGRVVLDEALFFSGRTVVLDHGLGLFSLYGHLSESRVKAGRVVEASEVVGLVGATGRVTAPHLHWAVRIGDARVNGLELLALRAR